MATVKHIKIYNANYDAAVDYLTMQHDEFTGKAVLDEQGEMIPRDYYLLDGINCDPWSFQQECEAINALYEKNHTYREIKAHHYIVSFDPSDRDENGLTPERAQAIGMELAGKAFPGHQIIVCTHRDGHNSSGNIHCHIVINSVRKLDVAREDFMILPGDHLAGRKHHCSSQFLKFFKESTMEICQREQLYQVDLLSPAKVRITDREYWAQRRGQKVLDEANALLIAEGKAPVKTKFETVRSILRSQISSVMQDSLNMNEFREKLLKLYGIEAHISRGKISYLAPESGKPIRGKRLGTDFDLESIQNFFLEKEHSLSSLNTDSAIPVPDTSIRLIVDLQTCIKAQQNGNYARKVKITNLQQAAHTVAFLQENHIGTQDELAALYNAAETDMQRHHDALLSIESRLKTVNQMIRLTGQYYANKKIYSQFLHAKNRLQFRQEHEPQILLYEAARKELRTLSGGDKLPGMKKLREEKEELTSRKNMFYENYSFSRSRCHQLQTIIENVDLILQGQNKIPGLPDIAVDHDKQSPDR